MSETLLPPLGEDDDYPGLSLDAFDEESPTALDDLLAKLTSAAEEKVGFDDLSLASPYGRFGSWLRSRPFLNTRLRPNETAEVELTRNTVASEMRYRYGDDEIVDDAKILASELATNVLLHGAAKESDVAIAGIFRARTIRGGVVFEAANGSASTVDSDDAKARGSHESGNGFKIIQEIAAEHGGKVGKYMVVQGMFGREKIITDPDEIRRVEGRWVIWASFQAQEDQTLAA
jgi:hypothetical protein